MKIILKKIIKYVLIQISRVKWFQTSKRYKNSFPRTVHVLVVNNTKYLFFARICIESFTYFHPNSNVVLHCDLNTYYHAKKYFMITKVFRDISIVNDQEINTDWKLSKLKLLLSMNGTSDIFIDADMRWNGCLNLDKNIYFLVREFPLWKSSDYLDFFSSLKIELNEKKYMWNTSFFTFNSIRINENIIKRMYEFYEKLTLIYESNGKEFNSNSIKERLIELTGIDIASAKKLAKALLFCRINEAGFSSTKGCK